MTDATEVRPANGKGWLLAVDIGGTFTDVTLADPRTGYLQVIKTPTDPDDPAAGFGRAIELVLTAVGLEPAAVERTFHASTIATNAVLEGKGAATALICTAGFRHVLEIGRHDGPRRTSMLHWIKPQRPVPPDRIFEVAERISHRGDVEVPLDESRVGEIAAQLRMLRVESLAICLLGSYANPVHERAVRRRILDLCPGLPVSVSSDVLPVFREYERTMATVLNAYVMPSMSGYLRRLSERLAQIGIASDLLVMRSNGGLARPSAVAARPAWTVLSGPAAGVIAAAGVARATGTGDCISLDVGGTSTDVALVRAGEPQMTDEGSVGPWPLTLPMLDVHTIGSGGGSIAAVLGDGTISVGPRSAGSQPGPACYGLGGDQPTVTDAHLLLGRIPDRLAGGSVHLDRDAALRAITDVIAEPLGLDPMVAASGIVEIADHDIAAAIRLITTERGFDPRAYVLVAGGGAGPLHAAAVAGLLGVSTVLVPDHAGVMATIGLLLADLRHEAVRTHIADVAVEPSSRLRTLVRQLEAEAIAWFEDERVAPRRRRLRWSASLRYAGQATELHVSWPSARRASKAAIAELRSAFDARHRERYGYDLPAAPVEIAALRALATTDSPSFASASVDRTRRGRGPSRRRPVHVDRSTGFASAWIVDVSSVPVRGVSGPAVIEGSVSTIYVPPGWLAKGGPARSLALTREARR